MNIPSMRPNPDSSGTESRRTRAGFTLLEIMIVVAIIGLLAIIAIPAFTRARRNTAVNALANDIRVFTAGFEQYAMDHGGFPVDTPPWKILPGGMADYIKPAKWAATTPCGGAYWYKSPVTPAYNYAPCIGIIGGPSLELMDLLDKKIDDGAPLTGNLRRAGVNYYYLMQ